MVWSTGYESKTDDSPISSDYVSSAISDFSSGVDGGDSSTPFYDQRVVSPVNLQKEIMQFRTGIPQMTRAEFLQDPRVNISPYARNQVNIGSEDDQGFIAMPEDVQAINMTMGRRTDLTGNMDIPYAKKGFSERFDEKVNDLFGEDDREQRVVMTGGDRPELQGTYGVKSENTLEDVIANIVNPFGFIKFDSRTLQPYQGGEDFQLARVASPFGSSTSITPYSELNTDTVGGDGSEQMMVADAVVPRPVRSLVPMGNQAYNPYGYSAYNPSPAPAYRSPYDYSISGLLG